MLQSPIGKYYRAKFVASLHEKLQTDKRLFCNSEMKKYYYRFLSEKNWTMIHQITTKIIKSWVHYFIPDNLNFAVGMHERWWYGCQLWKFTCSIVVGKFIYRRKTAIFKRKSRRENYRWNNGGNCLRDHWRLTISECNSWEGSYSFFKIKIYVNEILYL